MGMFIHGSEPNRHRSSDPSCICDGCHVPGKVHVIEHHTETIKEVPAKGADLTKYTVEKREEIGDFTIAWVRYHEVQPYTGLKLMVYNTSELAKAEEQKRVDPHFLPWHPSPLARFEPTALGDWLAHKLVEIMMVKP